MRKTLKYLNRHGKDIGIVRGELIRAHVMIVLLSLVIITLLTLSSTNEVIFNPILSAIAITLLDVIAIISLIVAIAVARQRK
jgi:hypothetical protein